jgi:hypothetical protein
VRKRKRVEGSKIVVIDAKWWQKGKGEVADQETTHIRKSIIDKSACSEVTTYPSPYDANLWRLLDQGVFDNQVRSARLAKHGMELGWRGNWHFQRAVVA